MMRGLNIIAALLLSLAPVLQPCALRALASQCPCMPRSTQNRVADELVTPPAPVKKHCCCRGKAKRQPAGPIVQESPADSSQCCASSPKVLTILPVISGTVIEQQGRVDTSTCIAPAIRDTDTSGTTVAGARPPPLISTGIQIHALRI